MIPERLIRYRVPDKSMVRSLRARLARLFEELWADRREQEISWTAPSG